MIQFEQYFGFRKNGGIQKRFDEVYSLLEDEKNSDTIGYYTLAQKSKKIFKEIKEFQKTNKLIQENKTKNIVVIGIGGSSLGTKAVYEILKLKQTSPIQLHFLENVDPLEIENTTNMLKKKNTLFIVISKSGGTIETISIFKYVMEKFKINLSKENDRVVAITDKGSSLSDLASKYKITQFNIPANVGGRFSVLSAVGIVPLSLAGFNVKGLLKGFNGFIDSFFDKNEEHLLQKAYFYHKNANSYPINTLFSYSTCLSYFNDWYVQLWGESLGKIDDKNNKVGLTPVGLVGSIDQHSFLQLIIQGPKNKTVSFIQIEDFENDITIPEISYEYLEKTDFINGYTFNKLLNEEANATMQSVQDENIPVDLIKLHKLTEKNIGVLIAYFELLTSATGQFFGINTYNQPGVEFGKKKLVATFQ